MGQEGHEKPPKAWQAEKSLNLNITLPLLHGSELRSTLSNDAEGFSRLVNKVGNFKKLFLFEGDNETIFAQVNVAEIIDDSEALDATLEDWNIKSDTYIGYGEGNGRVGFTTAGKLRDTLQSLAILRSDTLSIFAPVPVTEDMKDTD
jgi:hypothetical protein